MALAVAQQCIALSRGVGTRRVCFRSKRPVIRLSCPSVPPAATPNGRSTERPPSRGFFASISSGAEPTRPYPVGSKTHR
jgi:hypothetical protein